MEEIIEWIGEVLVGIFTESRKGLWFLTGTVLTVFGIIQINHGGSVPLTVFLFILALLSFLMTIRKRKNR